jgi:hypothetical protein
VTDERLARLENDLAEIKQRNLRVEADKAWEVSPLRISSICLITYLVASLLLHLLGSKRFWLDALVPVIGFYLSSQSLTVIKSWWIDHVYGSKINAGKTPALPETKQNQ